jgi:parallel beta-helix repeat protein
MNTIYTKGNTMRMGRHSMHQLVLSILLGTGLMLGSILSPRAATATTYYVARTGNDTNPCSQSRPCQTIAKGLRMLHAGDTLYLRGGTYNEAIHSAKQTIPTGTSWSNPVTIAAYPGETVTLQPSGGGNVLNLSASYIQYVIFNGLVLDAVNVHDNVFFGSGAHHIRIQNGEVKNAPGQGISGWSGTNIELINLKIHHNGLTRYEHGIYIAIPNALIEGCDIYNNSGYGIQIYNGSGCCAHNTVIRKNKIHDNRDAGVTLNHGNNILFYNNIVYDNTYAGVSVSYGTPTNTQIYNNTIYHTLKGNGINISSKSNGAKVQNNIIYNNAVVSIDNRGTNTVLSNNWTADPKFMNAAMKDFRLQATSPVINAGITLSAVPTDMNGISRPQGAKYDIGAYEYQGIQISSPKNFRLATQ